MNNQDPDREVEPNVWQTLALNSVVLEGEESIGPQEPKVKAQKWQSSDAPGDHQKHQKAAGHVGGDLEVAQQLFGWLDLALG